MSDPTNWVQCCLSDLGSIVTGKTPSTKQPENFGGDIPFIKPGDLDTGGCITKTETTLTAKGLSLVPTLPKNSITVTCIGNLGKVGITSRESATNQQINSVIPSPEIDYKYLYLYIRTIKGWLERESSATTVAIINKGRFSLAPVPLPPLAEQKEIAGRLDDLLGRVDRLKARLDAIPAILKRFRQSVLSAATSGKLTEDWREKNLSSDLKKLQEIVSYERKKAWLNEQSKAASRKGISFDKNRIQKKYKKPVDGYLDEFQLTSIHKIPDEWIKSNLDSVSIAVTGKTPSTSEKENWNGTIPFISPSQITPEGSIIEPQRYVSDSGAMKTPIIPDGSILIVCIGTIGKVGLLNKESAFNQQINALIPTGAMKKEFLFMWAQTLHNWLNKTSSAVVNAAIINKSRLCLSPCPIPPMSEQTEIVRRVEELFRFSDKIESRVATAQRSVNSLTQSILAKAFRGELTADWRQAHPDLITGENSAQALLQKIQTARSQLTSKPKKRAKKRSPSTASS